jgi:hypothetical protein
MKKSLIFLLLCAVHIVAVCSHGRQALGSEKYRPDVQRWNQEKAFFDDPRPVFRNYPLKEIIPKQVYARWVEQDPGTFEEQWRSVVGFAPTGRVGTLAPEITPGLYHSSDKEAHAGLEDLMHPVHFQRFKSGGRFAACSFAEIEVIPTRPVFYSREVAEWTLRNMGKARQDAQGYLVEDSYINGFPFPRPSGPHKAQQILYNYQERYAMGTHGIFALTRAASWDRGGRRIYEHSAEFWGLRLSGRVEPPVGWYDETARVRSEHRVTNFRYLSPRDQYGNVVSTLSFRNPGLSNQMMVWLGQIRRLRKLSGTDTQDASPGLSVTYDDFEGFSQKMSPDIHPYTYRVLAEREYLFPCYDRDGSSYLSKKRLALKNVKFERRPVYVIELVQQDPNYVYSKRILYFDQETFLLLMIENYDRQGRLWRTFEQAYAFYPEIGLINTHWVVLQDHRSGQTSYLDYFSVPAHWVGREDVRIGSMEEAGK